MPRLSQEDAQRVLKALALLVQRPDGKQDRASLEPIIARLSQRVAQCIAPKRLRDRASGPRGLHKEYEGQPCTRQPGSERSAKGVPP